jgi:hypothetical protein
MSVCDVADIGPVKQVVIVAYLKSGLLVDNDRLEARELLSIIRTKDPSRTKRTGSQYSFFLPLEWLPVRVNDQTLSVGLGLVIRVQSGLRDVHPLVDINQILASVVDDSGARRVDELLDSVGDARRNDVGCASDVDGFVQCRSLAVDW